MVTIIDGVGHMSIQNNGCTLWLSSIFYNIWVSLSVSMTDFPYGHEWGIYNFKGERDE